MTLSRFRVSFSQVSIVALIAFGAAGGGALLGQAETPVEATSLLGRPLVRPELPEEFRELQKGFLDEARATWEASPEDPDAAIWVGRRTAYLGRYREAIEIYSRALERSPSHARLYRHRGHRFITLRRLDGAIDDLERAARLIEGVPDEIEADGLPNDLGIPTSTSHTNIWYHLGLARYLTGDFEGATAAYRQCRSFATHPDMDVAAAYWLYLSLRRMGSEAAAAKVLESIAPDLEIIENHDYFELLRAFSRGGSAPDELLAATSDGVASATRAYGVGAWRLVEGDAGGARTVFEGILEDGSWAAFGYIAAEAELAR
jgi:tetratricopeptide (TPR) repeat protein